MIIIANVYHLPYSLYKHSLFEANTKQKGLVKILPSL